MLGGVSTVNAISNKPDIETRQERREKKLKKKRERVPQHGRNLFKIYKDAILKRLKRHRADK